MRGAGRRAEVDAAGEHRLDGLDRLHENKLRLQTFLAEKAAIAGNHKRHVEDAARHVGDAERRELGGFFRRP